MLKWFDGAEEVTDVPHRVEYATDRAAQVLNEFARANDPFKAVGERSVSIEVASVVRASESSFQVKWTEQTWQGGSLARTERWTGIFSIVIRQPRDVATRACRSRSPRPCSRPPTARPRRSSGVGCDCSRLASLR